MVSGTINLSTGPVKIIPEVRRAIASLPISHRSSEFKALYHDTSAILSSEYNVRHCFILTGSGTLANEAMLHQLKLIKGEGLILSNGEFGDRLIEQAKKIGLGFLEQRVCWGEAFDLERVNTVIEENQLSWLLFAHCETSTGMINNFAGLVSIAKKNNCGCFVDCMSTIGTRPLDLSAISMATASSGKGLASVPGLALIFSNLDPTPDPGIPSYLDLGQYVEKSGIPFTLSSNLLAALHASISQKLHPDQYRLNEIVRKQMAELFISAQVAPFADQFSNVFTLMPGEGYSEMLEDFLNNDIVISYESEYLRKRKWIQVALFNFYLEDELETALNKLKMILERASFRSKKKPKTIPGF